MSDPTHVDRDPLHLYAPFRAKLLAIIEQVNHETHGKHGVDRWIIEEGLRTQARQDWLWAQGRTRPGPIVTHIRVSNHSSGLAADCYPVDARGQILWSVADEIWEQFAHCVRANGMQSGRDFPTIHPGSTFVDNPHVEPPAALRGLWGPKAAAWLKGQGLA